MPHFAPAGDAFSRQTEGAFEITNVGYLQNKNIRSTIRDRLPTPNLPMYMQQVKEFLERVVENKGLDVGIGKPARKKCARDPVYDTKNIFTVTHDARPTDDPCHADQ